MRAPLTTRLRRYGVLLQSLDAMAGDTAVSWDSVSLGTLDRVRVHWGIRGAEIRMRVEAPDRRMLVQVVSVRAVAGGLEITARDGTPGPPHRLSIVGPGGRDAPAAGFRSLWRLLRRHLELRYPGAELAGVSAAGDRAHTLSASFLRVKLRWRGREYLVLSADPSAAPPEAHSVLTQALLWMDLLRRTREPARPPRMLLLVPPQAAAIVYHCSRLVDRTRARVSVWEWTEPESDAGLQLRRAHRPSPPVENRDFRWPVLGPFRWTPLLGRVLELAPECIRRYPRFHDYDSLRLFGLEFARAAGEDKARIVFGVQGGQTELTEENFPLLRSLVDEILYFRRPDSPDTSHPYYRMHAERWLESLILDDAARLFPELAPEAVYSQIPVYLGADPGRVDILAVDRYGTLVVMELKVAASPGLPVQALDYWARVTRHNQHGDFETRGYFAECRLSRRRPRIYLVSPVFSFHDSTERIAGWLDPALDVWKVSVNEDWRCGVRVLRRTRIGRAAESGSSGDR